MANIAADGVVLHGHKVFRTNDVTAACGCDKDVGSCHRIINSSHLIACVISTHVVTKGVHNKCCHIHVYVTGLAKTKHFAPTLKIEQGPIANTKSKGATYMYMYTCEIVRSEIQCKKIVNLDTRISLKLVFTYEEPVFQCTGSSWNSFSCPHWKDGVVNIWEAINSLYYEKQTLFTRV